jgi:putative membrane protein (TIGR04086 family)
MKQKVKRHPKKTVPVVRRQEKAREEASPAQFFKNAFHALLWSIGTAILLCVAAALAAYYSPDPTRIILPLGLSASALTALLGGMIAIRTHGHGALLAGLSNGALLMALMILGSLFCKPLATGYATWLSLLLHAIFLCLSVVGATLGRRRTPKRKKR